MSLLEVVSRAGDGPDRKLDLVRRGQFRIEEPIVNAIIEKPADRRCDVAGLGIDIDYPNKGFMVGHRDVGVGAVV